MSISSDISVASTIRTEVYFSPAVYEREKECVFARTWHVMSRVQEHQEPGSISPFTFMEGSLNEPLVMTVDEGGQVRCLSNVCTHRGNLLATKACSKGKHLQCSYHGRRFNLDGRFDSMPGFEGVKNFPSPKDDLPEVETHRLGPLLFGSLAPEVPFNEWIAPVLERTGFLPWDQAVFDPSSSRSYEFDASWALYVENFLEGFHVPFVHPGLVKELDFSKYETEQFKHSNLQIGIASKNDSVFDIPADHPDQGKKVAGYYFWLFPCTMLNLYPWGISLNRVIPRGPTRTQVIFESYVWDESKRAKGAGSDLHQVEMEDETVVLNVQRGVRSRLYQSGRYSVKHEKNLHHFHRMLEARLSEN